MDDIKQELNELHSKYQSYLTIADSFDDDHMEQRNAWMAKAGKIVGRILELEEQIRKENGNDA